MLNLASSVRIFLAVTFASSFASPPPSCSPDSVKEAVSCAALGTSVEVGGGLYSSWEFHFNPLMSPYYAARMADALGFPCPANKTFQAEMDLTTPWSGSHGAIAYDWAQGSNLAIVRDCIFPTDKYPFLCTGTPGTPGTDGTKLGTLSYISLLHDTVHHRWTLFGHCWNAKTPEYPNRVETATSWNVFSLDQTLSRRDKAGIIAKLRSFGFSTANLIEADYRTP